MIHLFKTNVGRLRLIGYLEGISLIILVTIAVPMKYFLDQPQLTKTMGPIHGALFLLFVFNTISVAAQFRWNNSLTWKVLLSCLVPFGTFYIDHKYLRNFSGEN